MLVCIGQMYNFFSREAGAGNIPAPASSESRNHHLDESSLTEMSIPETLINTAQVEGASIVSEFHSFSEDHGNFVSNLPTLQVTEDFSESTSQFAKQILASENDAVNFPDFPDFTGPAQP